MNNLLFLAGILGLGIYIGRLQTVEKVYNIHLTVNEIKK